MLLRGPSDRAMSRCAARERNARAARARRYLASFSCASVMGGGYCAAAETVSVSWASRIRIAPAHPRSMTMRTASSGLAAWLLLGLGAGFAPQTRPRRLAGLRSTTDDYQCTPKLQEIAQGFRALPDDKTRYKQLLFLAQQGPPMAAEYQTPENKVPGCLSTVFVHATLADDGTVHFLGDSDAQLTKGLVTLLVKGMSGNTAAEINAVQPEFIRHAGLAASLTPG